MIKLLYFLTFISFSVNASILDLSSHELKRLSSVISSKINESIKWESTVTSFVVSPVYYELGTQCRNVLIEKYKKQREYQACLKDGQWIIL